MAPKGLLLGDDEDLFSLPAVPKSPPLGPGAVDLANAFERSLGCCLKGLLVYSPSYLLYIHGLGDTDFP